MTLQETKSRQKMSMLELGDRINAVPICFPNGIGEMCFDRRTSHLHGGEVII